jgi:tRNA(Ile)-lysidine synthase
MRTGEKKARRHAAPRLRLSSFARDLLAAWKRTDLPTSSVTAVVAVSGGADSTALLLGVQELLSKGKLTINPVVAHLDHALRGESRMDRKWVKDLGAKLGMKVYSQRLDVGKLAKDTGDNLEQAARRARYAFLAKIGRQAGAHAILTGHTLDDQAETVLMRLLRGSGADGLAGIEPRRRLESSSELILARPLLEWARRTDTEDYCRLRKVSFRDDAMNVDPQFIRVRVRQQVIPLLASFNGRVVEGLARTAALLRDDVDVLDQLAEALLWKAKLGRNKIETNGTALHVRVLAEAPAAVRRRALRQWIAAGRGDLHRCELVHILGIEKLLSGQQGGRVAELPGGDKVVLKQNRLELLVKKR